MAEFISLYSGSSGNSSVVRCGQRYLIVDMGKGVRTTSAALKALGLAASDCDGILVTHEHSDHVKGLSTFLKKNTLPVYGAAATLDFLDSNGIVPASCELRELEGREEDVGAFGVQSFPAATLWHWRATTTCTCCAAGRTPITYGHALKAPGATFPTTNARQSCWNSFRKGAKSLRCAIFRRRTTRLRLPCRPCSTRWARRALCRRRTASCRHSAATK